MVFEPLEAGGLGVELEPKLLRAGVVAEAHFCSMQCEDEGIDGMEQGWCTDFEEARVMHVELADDRRTRVAWDKAVKMVQVNGEIAQPRAAQGLAAGGSVTRHTPTAEAGRRETALKTMAARLVKERDAVRAGRAAAISQEQWQRWLEQAVGAASRRRSNRHRHDRRRESRGRRYQGKTGVMGIFFFLRL